MAIKRKDRSKAARPFRWTKMLAGVLMTGPLLFSQAVVIDHRCTDPSLIPDVWLDQVKAILKVHYAHTSHGGQLTAGLERLADPALSVYDARLKYRLDYRTLPEGQDLCLMDGQATETYITPELYWKNGGDGLTRDVLNTFEAINVSLWAWCTQLDYYSENEVEDYLETVSELETAYPRVKFVYMTGNAQATGAAGFNRYLRNEQIRRFCRENNKILFDFADLDAWLNNEQATYDHNGQRVPVEHPLFHGDEAGHTTFLSCEIKAKAFWWMLARMAGWDETPNTSDCDCNGDGVIDERDFLLKKQQVLDRLSNLREIGGQLVFPKGKEAGHDHAEFLKEFRRFFQEIHLWAVRCGFTK